MYLRGVIEEPRYSQDLDALREQYPQIDEVQRRASWELSRNPRVGEPLEDAPDFRFLTTSPFEDVPSFRILYDFDEENVYLRSIAQKPKQS
jgi:hypothetical protein